MLDYNITILDYNYNPSTILSYTTTLEHNIVEYKYYSPAPRPP